MKECPYCGTEYEGNFCPNCGVSVDGYCLASESSAPARVGKSGAKKKFAIFTLVAVIIVALVLVVAYVIIPLIKTAKFNANNVSTLYGLRTSEVVRKLGEPNSKEENRYFWYEDKISGKIKEIENYEKKLENFDMDSVSFEDFDKFTQKLDKLYSELTEIEYKFIAVSFDTEKNKATEVFYDAKHTYTGVGYYPEKGKTVARTELIDVPELNGWIDGSAGIQITANIREDASYQAFYTDGSFYQAVFTNYTLTSNEDNKNATFAWRDSVNKSEYNKIVSLTVEYEVTNEGRLILSNGLKEIRNRMCYGNTKIITVTIPDGVIWIGNSAFSGCSSLTSVTIPDSVTLIGDGAFSECSSLTSVTIPDSVIWIGDWAFGGCSKLLNEYDNALYFGNSSNPYWALIKAEMWGMTSCTINENTKIISGGAFEGCYDLTSITIPDSVISIGNYAFKDCYDLTSVTIGNGVASIGYAAFYGCESLTSITIPDSVISIGNYAFEDCSNLASITIGNGVASIGYAAFYGCESLTSITIPDRESISDLHPTNSY